VETSAPVRIVGMQPAWGLASPSPFCLKLETWLRIAGIPYQPLALTKPPQSKSGKIPYLLLEDGGTLADSNAIIAHLSREYGIDPLHGRSSAEWARSHATVRMIEESLYFVAAWERWLTQHWPVARDAYFGIVPAAVRGVFGALVRRRMKAALHGQGTARRDPAAIAAHGRADVDALAALLGDGPWFDGARPGIADASAYGLLANVLAFPAQTPLKSAVQAHANLVDFCGRMERAYWTDGARMAGTARARGTAPAAA
jgi:glutathione S-transferase